MASKPQAYVILHANGPPTSQLLPCTFKPPCDLITSVFQEQFQLSIYSFRYSRRTLHTLTHNKTMYFIWSLPPQRERRIQVKELLQADQQRSDRDGFELKPGLQGFASNLCSATLWTPHSQRLLCFHSLLSPQSLDSTWQAFKKCVWNKWTNQRTTFGWLLCLKRQSVKTLQHLPSEVPQGITGIIFQNRL